MSGITSRPRMAGKTTEALEAHRAWLRSQAGYIDRREAIAADLRQQPAMQIVQDPAGRRWQLVTTRATRTWMDDDGQTILEHDLASLIAVQPHVRLSDGHLVAVARHAARAARWSVRGALRTPSVRLVGACLLTAALVGLLVAVR